MQGLGLALAVLAIVCRAASGLEVLHSLDGGKTYHLLGSISGDPSQDLLLFLEREELSASDADRLKQLIKSDGLYYVKLGTSGSVFSSIRATCFADASETTVKEQVVLSIAGDGTPLSVAYSISSPACYESHTDASNIITLPSSVKVTALKEVMGPALADAAPGAFSESILNIPDPLRSGEGDQGRSGEAGGQAGGQRRGPKQEKEKTWWEKNWLFVAAGVMMVFNIMAKVSGAAPQGGGGAAQRR